MAEKYRNGGDLYMPAEDVKTDTVQTEAAE